MAPVPFSDAEIRAWLADLAPTRDGRRRVLLDLLRHANGDSADRVICRQALDVVDREAADGGAAVRGAIETPQLAGTAGSSLTLSTSPDHGVLKS